MGVRGSFPRGKTTGAWSYLLTSSAEGVKTNFYSLPWLCPDCCEVHGQLYCAFKCDYGISELFLWNSRYVAFVFNIVARKNFDVDVDVDVCFMEEVVEITAGDMYTMYKDEKGERERRRVLCCMTAGRFVCAEYSVNSVLSLTAVQRQHAERNQQIKQFTYQISYDVLLVNLYPVRCCYVVNDILKNCTFVL